LLAVQAIDFGVIKTESITTTDKLTTTNNGLVSS